MSVELDARLQLRQLVDAYARTMDDGDEATLSSLFAPGGRLVIDTGRRAEFVAPDGFGPVIAAMARYDATFYLVGNHLLDGVEGERAWGETYCVGHHHQAAGDRPERLIINPVRYRDRYVLVGETWRFEERIATVLWTDVRELAGG